MTDGGQRPQQPRRPLQGASRAAGCAAGDGGAIRRWEGSGEGSHATVEGRESKVLIESCDIILKIPVRSDNTKEQVLFIQLGFQIYCCMTLRHRHLSVKLMLSLLL